MSSGVVSRRMQDDALAGSFLLDRLIGAEHGDARHAAGAGGQPRGDDLALRLRVDHGCRKDCTCSGDTRSSASCSSIMPSATISTAMRTDRPARALAAARLQHVEAPFLYRELDVLHVAVVFLEQSLRTVEFVVGLGQRSASASTGCGVRIPATTSSPAALNRNSPKNSRSPVAGLRVKATPEPESSPKLPNTMACTLTAVPSVSGMLFISR
jgi:hypothetical protein